jgi:C1A family cysteine protease
MTQDEFTSLQRTIWRRGYDWQAGPTSLSNLDPEAQALRLGLRLEPEEMARLASSMAEEAPRVVEFPTAWDWRDVEGADWTTPIRDQGACGSCVAFGTVAVLETMHKRLRQDPGLVTDLSEAHLFFCGCGACCSRGWWPTYALDYAQQGGVPDESCFPYQDRNLACSSTCDDWLDRTVRVVAWQEILEVGARKEWLATRGPMVGCMAVYGDFFSYVGGVYRHASGTLSGYHAIGVVGYSEDDQAWICKNSWGTDWGEGGWFKIGYGECKIDTEFAMYGVEAVVEGSPGPPPPPPPDPAPGCNLWRRLVQALRPAGPSSVA